MDNQFLVNLSNSKVAILDTQNSKVIKSIDLTNKQTVAFFGEYPNATKQPLVDMVVKSYPHTNVSGIKFYDQQGNEKDVIGDSKFAVLSFEKDIR